MSINKTLLVSLACAALASGPAMAFDDVNWVWNSTVTDNINRNVNVQINSNPSGLVQVEKIQTQIGDVSAESTVSGIHNTPPGIGENGVVSLDETMTVTTNYNKPIGVGNSTNASSGIVTNDPNGQIQGEFVSGTLSEQANAYTDIIDVHLTGEIALEDVGGVNSALDLPKVNSAATAVGNNQAIESSVSLALHDSQILSGADGSLANVRSTSTVSDILNASVESAATAVGNNMDVKLASATVGDTFAIADITQSSTANITAVSSVSDVAVNDYTNFSGAGMGPLGDPQTNLVNSVATAVGNNMAIKVTSPTL